MAATIHYHRATFVAGGQTRDIEIAVVRRIVARPNGRGRTTQTKLVDAGAATAITAGQIARRFAGLDGEIRATQHNHGSLGEYSADDAGREAMLEAFWALPMGLPAQWGKVQVVDSAVEFDRSPVLA